MFIKQVLTPLMPIVVVILVAVVAGCESSPEQQRQTTAGPNPTWVEQFHREQLRYEYERMRYEEQMRGR